MKLMGRDTEDEDYDGEQFVDTPSRKSKIKADKPKFCNRCGFVKKDGTKHIYRYRTVSKKIGESVREDAMGTKIKIPIFKNEKEYDHCDIQELFGNPSGKKKDGIPLWNPSVPTYKEMKIDDFIQ